jgi:hypothetical protein
LKTPANTRATMSRKRDAYLRALMFRAGRIRLSVLYVALLGMDYLMYTGCNPAEQHKVTGLILIHLLFTTAFFGAMWRRQNWARYTMFFFLLAVCTLQLLLETGNEKWSSPMKGPLWTFGIVAGQGAAALLLAFWQPIRKLTTRDYFFE